MINNPDVNVRTDWAIDDAVKPVHMTALTSSIPYDYVVTAEMLSAATPNENGELDVDALLGGAKIHGVPSGKFHILINAVVPPGTILFFPDASVGAPDGNVQVHVYTIAPFTAHIGANGSPYFHFYFHTHGSAEAVTISAASAADIHVGAFISKKAFVIPASHSFVYESALGEVPTATDSSIVAQAAWMSNSVGAGNTGVISISSYADKIGNVFAHASDSSGPLPDTIGLSANTPLDLSKANTVRWITWTRRGRLEVDPWYEENPNTTLHIDPNSMIDGVIYHVDVACYCDAHESRITGGLHISRATPTFQFEYKIGQGSWASKAVALAEIPALPIVENGATCDVTITCSNNRPSSFTFGAPLNMELPVTWGSAYDYAATPSRAKCPVSSTPGELEIDLGKPTGYTGDGTERVRLTSNVGISANSPADIQYSPLRLDGVLHMSTPTACMYTPSASEPVSILPISLGQAAGDAYAAVGSHDTPAFHGDVYMFRSGEKVYVLGY